MPGTTCGSVRLTRNHVDHQPLTEHPPSAHVDTHLIGLEPKRNWTPREHTPLASWPHPRHDPDFPPSHTRTPRPPKHLSHPAHTPSCTPCTPIHPHPRSTHSNTCRPGLTRLRPCRKPLSRNQSSRRCGEGVFCRSGLQARQSGAAGVPPRNTRRHTQRHTSKPLQAPRTPNPLRAPLRGPWRFSER